MSAPKRFPVLGISKQQAALGCPQSVPWELLAPHEEQAQWNHSQSLERLASRGGLAPCEMVAVLENRRWRKMTDEESVTALRAFLAETKGETSDGT